MKLILWIKALIPLFLWSVLRPILKLIPLKLLYKLAAVSAAVSYVASPGKKKIIIEELRKIFEDKSPSELKQIVFRSFIIYYKRQAENLVFDRLDKEKTSSLISIEGMENLDAALKDGKGVLVMVAHFGSHLLIPLALAHRGYKVNQVTITPDIKNAPNIVHHMVAEMKKKEYENLPINFLHGKESLHKIFKLLKANELVVIALDGREGQKWVPVTMFNKTAMLLPGIVKISEHTGAPIVPMFIVKQPDDTHRLFIEPSILLKQAENKDDAVLINTGKLAHILERYIRDYPCHYALILLMMRRNYNRGIIKFPLIKG